MLRSHWMGLALALVLPACSDDGEPDETPEPSIGDPDYERDPALDVENVSRHGSSDSHFGGVNCMNCHQPHGPGRGLFSIGGTLHNADGSLHPNGTVYVTRQDPARLPEGTSIDELEIDPIATIEADALGNFYSTEALPIPEEPVFVIVERSDGGGRNFMGWSTMTLACNACHVGSNVLAVRE